MAKRYTREDIIDRLWKQVDKGKAILMFGAGSGLTAKCADIGGADLIAVYSTAKYRMMGLPTLLAWMPYSNANEHVVQMAKEILPVVKEAPCIAGIGAHDPAVNIPAIIDHFVDIGFSGVTNEPFAGLYGPEFAQQLEAAGIGFAREVRLIEEAHRKNIFTVAWAFNPAEAEIMAKAGADVVGAIVGVTTGGLTGAKESLALQAATKQVEGVCKAVYSINPDIFVLTHGGPIKDVSSADYSIRNSSAKGYASGSSGERVPTEEAVIKITREYREIGLS